MATYALQELKAERDEAKGQLKSGATGQGLLSQLAAAADDPEAEEARLKSQANRLFTQGATDTRDSSFRLAFKLNSAGLSAGDVAFAGRAAAARVLESPGGTATAYAGIRAAFKGGDAVGSFEEVVSKGIAASKHAPASADQLLQEAAKSGASAKTLGFTDEFVLGATARASLPTGSVSEGGTQVRGFFRGLERKGIQVDPSLRGLSGIETIRDISSRNLDRAGLARLIGDDSEGIAGFRTLEADLPALEADVKRINAANRVSLGEAAVKRNLRNIEIGPVVAERQADNLRTLGQIKDAAAGTQANAIIANREALERKTAPGLLTETIIGVGRFNKFLHDSFGGSGQAALESVLSDGLRTDRSQRNLGEQILHELRNIKESNLQIERRQHQPSTRMPE